MSLEQDIYKNLGVRKEYDHLNPIAAAVFVRRSRKWAKKTGLQITGSGLPAYGAAMLITMHIDSHDGYRMCIAGVDYTKTEDGKPALGRIMRGVAKYTLLHPFAEEAPEVRQATGKTDDYNSDSFLVKAFQSVTVAPVLGGIGAIGIRRGETDRTALTAIDQALKAHQLVGMSLPGTRIEDGTIQEIKHGPSLILAKHPGVPYYLVAISSEPNLVNIAGPFTFAETKKKSGAVNLREITLTLGDDLAKIAIPRVREAWINGGRDAERQKLYGKRIATPSEV